MQFQRNFYVKLVDSHPNGATEVLVDSSTGAASIEYGPAMTWTPERISEALANLLTNALRHTPSGGIVKVSARARAEQLVIGVADTGEGIGSQAPRPCS